MTPLAKEMRAELIAGYRKFRSRDFAEQKDLYESLGKDGQSPRVMLISCSDSRVDPTDIFHAYPGEMFVLRNVANIVPRGDVATPTPGTGAALEFAVNVLKVKVIVVMGHESCGGVKGCMDGIKDGYVGAWISHLSPARDRIMARGLNEKDALFELELEGVRQSLQNLMSFDFISEKVEAGELAIQGAYFSIISARLLMMDGTGQFSEVDPD
jgi:carbonic anhydrase